jgi:hypothetical protein
MPYKKISERFCPCINDFVREYIADTDADLENLPKSGTGSTGVSLESGKVKAVNTQGDWVNFGG